MGSEKKKEKVGVQAKVGLGGGESMLGSLWHLQVPSARLCTTHIFPYLIPSMVLPEQHFHPQSLQTPEAQRMQYLPMDSQEDKQGLEAS